MFPLRYNFTLRFLMWKTKGGNPKGLGGVPPLSIPFGDVLIGLRLRLYGFQVAKWEKYL